MKSLKAAAVVVGSLIVSGAAAPAFAAEPMPRSINQDTFTPIGSVTVLDTPLNHPADLLDAENADSPLHKVRNAKLALANTESLQRGLPLQG
jgi:hypothetical protein